MAPATHLLLGWLTAETCPILPARDRFWIAIAGVLPDADGLGLVAGLLTGSWDRAQAWFAAWHHIVLHNLLAGLVAAVAIGLWCRSWRTAGLVLASFHLHLLGDVVGSRGPDGYDWPIPYLAPFHGWQWTWDGQWALNAWPNTLITLIAIVVSLVLAVRRGRWITELLSRRLDVAVVAVLRRRLTRTG
jgi:hypothetical protein